MEELALETDHLDLWLACSAVPLSWKPRLQLCLFVFCFCFFLVVDCLFVCKRGVQVFSMTCDNMRVLSQLDGKIQYIFACYAYHQTDKFKITNSWPSKNDHDDVS